MSVVSKPQEALLVKLAKEGDASISEIAVPFDEPVSEIIRALQAGGYIERCGATHDRVRLTRVGMDFAATLSETEPLIPNSVLERRERFARAMLNPAKAVPPEYQKTPSDNTLVYCSFCGKSQRDVRKLVAGPSVFICDECLDVSIDIIDEEGGRSRYSTALEFPPEYRQAGLDLLTYFGTVVSQKYPGIPVSVRIEQSGTKITLHIETPDGELEKIERTLEQYALVVAGKDSPDSLGLNSLQVIELKAELRAAQNRVETQRELLAYKDASYAALAELFARTIDAGKASVQVVVSPQISQLTTVSCTRVQADLQSLQEALQDAAAKLSGDDPAQTALNEAAAAAQTARRAEPGNVATPELARKLQRAAEYVADTTGSVQKTLKNVDDSGGLLKKLALSYNAIAVFAGWPPLPLP